MAKARNISGKGQMMSDAPQGLTTKAAADRLAQDGPNALPQPKRRNPFRLIFDVLKEPMLLLLLAGGMIYFILGNHTEAVVLLAFACISITITFAQEARSERVLAALRDLTTPTAIVIRDGARQKISAADIVIGDLIAIAEGARVPADAALLAGAQLTLDESLLTGESVPIRKGFDPKEDALIYAGSLVVGGEGLAQVTATGVHSEIGQIGKSLNLLETQTPHLQAQLKRMVFWFAAFGGGISLLVVLLYGLLRGGDWLAATLAGIAVGMAMLPEEFPMVLTVFMAMGTWRISKARVLTRRAAAIETLGAASVLCTDKTGTLTENKMTIASIVPVNAMPSQDLSDPDRLDLAQAGTRACAPNPFDPMEKAFHARSPLGDGELIRSYAISPELLAMTQVWDEGGQKTAYAKGAPEAIATLCGLPHDAKAVAKLAALGQRVLAVARAKTDKLPDDQTGFNFQYLGLIGLIDPLRTAVPKAVASCQAAGIRVIMITGDHPVTALAIGHSAGIRGDRAITGDQITVMSDSDFSAALRETSIFARINPTQKLRIVQGLAAEGLVVAMTGDGVNDALSLRAADIGISMGGRGTDVAREASDIVLLDDNFDAIVTTIALGRRIYDNIRKAMSFILAVHIPIAGLALMPLILGAPLLFGPVHVAFFEMIIDPVCALVFEAEDGEDDLMRRPPRAADAPLFSRNIIFWALLQGVIVFGLVTAIYLGSGYYALNAGQIRALTFAGLVFGILALILVNRRRNASVLSAFVTRNSTLGLILLGIAGMLTLVMAWPVARGLFDFVLPPNIWWAAPPMAGLAALLLMELTKPLFAKSPT